jgi:hypothetical protein
MAQRPKHLKRSDQFPKLMKKDHTVTSDQDARYNCIAYAADITDKKFWPNWDPDYTWPKDIPRAVTIEAFIAFYGQYGYSGPSDAGFDATKDKVAIFVDKRGTPTHAAKQIGPNKWASKLGNSYDIEHARDAVSGGLYGEMAHYLERPKK